MGGVCWSAALCGDWDGYGAIQIGRIPLLPTVPPQRIAMADACSRGWAVRPSIQTGEVSESSPPSPSCREGDGSTGRMSASPRGRERGFGTETEVPSRAPDEALIFAACADGVRREAEIVVSPAVRHV